MGKSVLSPSPVLVPIKDRGSFVQWAQEKSKEGSGMRLGGGYAMDGAAPPSRALGAPLRLPRATGPGTA